MNEAVVATPPVFGAGKPHRIRMLVWYERDDTENMALIPFGMAVSEKMRGYYWQKRSQFAQILEAKRLGGATGPHNFVLVAGGGAVVATGPLHEDDDADSLAWLGCFFAESMGLMFAVPFKPEHRTSAMEGHVFSVDDKLHLRVQP